MKRVDEVILTTCLDGELFSTEQEWVESQLAESDKLQATLTQLRWEKSLVDQGLDILDLPLPQTSPAQKFSFSKNESTTSELMVWESLGIWSDIGNRIKRALGGWRFYMQTAVVIGVIIIGVNILRMGRGVSSEILYGATIAIEGISTLLGVTPPNTTKPILFTTSSTAVETRDKIYIFDLTNSTSISLSDLHPNAHSPSLALAGEQVIISVVEDGDIVVMDGKGNTPVNLTNTPDIMEASPVLSPDGQRVAFTEGRNFLLINLNDGRQETIATGISGHGLVWSPNGQYLAFVSDKGGQSDLYVIDLDEANLIRLTNDTRMEMHPAWSPDSRRIVFADGEGLTIVDVAEAKQTQLPYHNPDYFFPRQPLWSPDGTRIAFVDSRADNMPTLFTIEVDSGRLTPLTDEQTWAGASFDWSPDGRQLVFAKGKFFYQEQLYVMNADGSGQTQLTDDKIKKVDCIEWGVR